MGTLFGIDRCKVSNVFNHVLNSFYVKASKLLYWPSREQIDARMPSSFKKNYPKTRCIIDCTEVACEVPKESHQKVLLYSNYKNKHTIKWLVKVAPSGEFTYISRAYGGRATDSQITTESNLIQMLDPGDVILADKGFPKIVSETINNVGSFLVLPPHKSTGRQFSGRQNDISYNVASVRIHVERAIGRVKHFKILEKFTQSMVPYADKIFVILCFVSNNFPDIIKEID